MSHADAIAPTVIVLAVVLALLGGWEMALAGVLDPSLKKVNRATGVLFLALSLQRFNAIRVAGVARDETRSMTVLRVVAIVAAGIVLAMHARHRRGVERTGR